MKKRLLALSVIGIALLGLVGCSTNDKGKEESKSVARDLTPYGKYEEPVEFTIGRSKFMNDLPEGMTVEDNAATKYVEEMANVFTKVAWESQDTEQKIALSISTGDIPDVMIVNRQQYKQLVDNDLIADLTEVYEKTASDTLKEVYDSFGGTILDQVTIDGKLMGLPTTNIGLQQDLLWIRKDWLEELGRDLPKTKEEVYDLAREMAEQDLAGDGSTVALTMAPKVAGTYNVGGYSLNPIFYANESYPRQWIPKDGKTVYGTIQPETKKTLEELSQLYKEGTIDQQFAVRKYDDVIALLSTGKLGMLFAPWWVPHDLQKSIVNDPDVDWTVVAAPADENDNINVPFVDPVGSIIVVKKDFKHPEAILKSINLTRDFTWKLTPESKEFSEKNLPPELQLSWDHLLTPIPAQFDYYNAVELFYNDLTAAIEEGTGEGVKPYIYDRYESYQKLKEEGWKSEPTEWAEVTARLDGQKAAIDERVKNLDVNFFETTTTMETAWTSLEKLEDEMFIRIITGEEPLSYFDEFVEQWNKIGGETITKEVNEIVEAR